MSAVLDDAPRPTDRLFFDSPDAGEPTCVCSRCCQRISDREVPVRIVVKMRRSVLDPGGDRMGEYRYHARCVSVALSTDPPEENT